MRLYLITIYINTVNDERHPVKFQQFSYFMFVSHMFNGHKMASKIGTIVFCINFNSFRTMCQDGIISYCQLWNSAVKYKAAQENSIFSMESHSRRFQNISQIHTIITLLKYTKVSIVVGIYICLAAFQR